MKIKANRFSVVGLISQMPLTPALFLSEGERENRSQSSAKSGVVGKSGAKSVHAEHFGDRLLLFPLPRGGGLG